VPFSFDFESVPATTSGALTSLTLTSGSFSGTLTRSGSAAFDVVANIGGQAGKPAGWGTRSLSPFFTLPGDSWVLTFSAPVLSLSMEFGDYIPSDNDSPVTLVAYSGLNATGFIIDSNAALWTSSSRFPGFGSLSVAGPAIPFQSVVFSSSGPAPNSLFWDNLAGEAVPEPGTLVLIGSGLTALALRRRRRS
jgi:hypothetical protein